MTEHALHKTVAEYLDLVLPHDAVWTTIGHGGFKLPIQVARAMKARGVKAGWPDIQILWRHAYYGIELKTRKGVLSKAQKELHPRLRATGAQVAICRSIEDVTSTLKDWGMKGYWRAA